MRIPITTLLFIALLSPAACFAQAPDTLLPLIPQPVQAIRGEGVFQLRDYTVIALGNGVSPKEAEPFVQFLEAYYGLRLRVVTKHSGVGAIRLSAEMKEDKPMPEHAYRLTVNKTGILIEGKGDGLFHGLQTLLQLIPAGPVNEYDIPCVAITDYPRFPWRGMHLDVSRHFFSKQDVKRYLDYLALYKLNVFHWHLTDDQGWRIEIRSRPKLTQIGAWRKGTLLGHYSEEPDRYDSTRYGGFYTQDDVKEIIAYAQQRHITVVPEIELPGHSLAALAAYPELACTDGPFETARTWGVFDDVLCPEEETFKFLEDVLGEVCALFPGRYIHIGGDECPKDRWKQSAFCRELMKRENLKDEHELQSWFIRRVEKIVNAKGKQIIGWDEILEGGLAPGAAVMSWRGEEGGIAAARQKHYVVMSPTSHCYFDYYQSQAAGEPLAIGGFLPLEKVYSYDPLPAALSVDETQYVMGAQGNVWTEYMRSFQQVEYMALPRMAALAEVVWTMKSKKDYENFLARLTPHLLILDRMAANYSKAIFYIEPELSPGPPGKPGLTLNLRTRAKVGLIRLAVNQEVVNNNSAVFDKPLHLQRSTDVMAAVFEGPNRRSPVYRQSFIITFSTGRNVKLLTDPDPKYSGSGGFTLVNGVLGRLPWNGADWLGYQGRNLEAVIDLGVTASFRRVRVDALRDEGSWIHFPKSVEVLVSNDGIQFISAKKIEGEDVSKSARNIIVDVGFQMARYVKVIVENAGTIPAGRPGEGQAAWLFVDEIMIE